jgi:hypothetical protein
MKFGELENYKFDFERKLSLPSRVVFCDLPKSDNFRSKPFRKVEQSKNPFRSIASAMPKAIIRVSANEYRGLLF